GRRPAAGGGRALASPRPRWVTAPRRGTGGIVDATTLARSRGAEGATPRIAAGPHRVPPVGRPRWLDVYVGALVALDAVAMAAATFTAKVSWLGLEPRDLQIRSFSIPYSALVVATVPAWIVLLALSGAYAVGPFGTAPQWGRVVRSGAQLLAVVAVSYYIAHLAMLGRGVLAATIPLAVTFTLVGRWLAGVGLAALRRRRRARRTGLVVGSPAGIEAFTARAGDLPAAGVEVVDTVAVTPGNGRGPETDLAATIAGALARTRAETVLIAGGLAQGRLRDIAWMLEGSGVALLVVPT